MKDYPGVDEPVKSLGTDVPTLVALLVCLIPTTIGALLAAIGIAGMDRALRANIIAKSGKAVEVAGDVDTLLLDKTGTITIGNRRATQFVPVGDYTAGELGQLAALASVADQTPEGKSIVELYHKIRRPTRGSDRPPGRDAAEGPLRRIHGPDAHERRRSARRPADSQGGPGRDAQARAGQQRQALPADMQEQVDAVASQGATPLLVCEGNQIAGMVVLEDILKPGIRDRFERLRRWACARSW